MYWQLGVEFCPQLRTQMIVFGLDVEGELCLR